MPRKNCSPTIRRSPCSIPAADAPKRAADGCTPGTTDPWQGPDPPAAVYLYSPDRKAEHPASHLARFSGVLQVDGYPGFDRLGDSGVIRLAACWAHARRKFYDVQQATSSPVAAEALRRIAELYAVETAIRGQTAAERQGTRQSSSLQLRDELLNGEIFYTMKEARVVIEGWRRHYNTVRPHSSLGYKPPAPAAVSWPASQPGPASPATPAVAPRPIMN